MLILHCGLWSTTPVPFAIPQRDRYSVHRKPLCLTNQPRALGLRTSFHDTLTRLCAWNEELEKAGISVTPICELYGSTNWSLDSDIGVCAGLACEGSACS